MQVGASAEREPRQKLIQIAAAVALCAIMLVPGLERHVWSAPIPVSAVVVADVFVVAGFWIIYLTFRENSHASGIIEVHADQTVISSGPYALVRHPMYSGAALMFLATPVALGSTWAMALAPVVVLVLAVRLRDEERFLSANLPGYAAYCRQVRWHLLPFVW
jgi:protein-S-isoprenylcysteine O-methyltransferase Ste14